MNVAFIPVRGGSKSIPLKNIKIMCNKPLVYWTVAAACACNKIDAVYVATDSEQIRQVVEGFRQEGEIFEKLNVIQRSDESASDTASTEFAMLEFAKEYEFEHIVLIQATSPLLTSKELEQGFDIYEEEDTDSVLSVVRQKRFNWNIDHEGIASPINYDVYKRPRRQEYEGYFVENGAFYITSKQGLIKSGNRVFGRIKLCEMSEDAYWEIDEPDDWVIIEYLLKRRLTREMHKDGSKQIKMFLTDCDGCLTDGGMYYTENGDELKKFCAQDGMGFQLLKDKGVLCGIVTGEKVSLVKRRANKLKLDILEMGVQNKLSIVKKLCQDYHIELSEVAYVGDDVNDIEVIEAVGVSFSVPNAIDSVKRRADIVTKHNGGDGAVREAIEYILQNKVLGYEMENADYISKK